MLPRAADGQYKKKIDCWFWWEATYYDDNQAGLGTVDLFTSADTFGTTTSDASYGEAGGANGNGLFFYPGTDTKFPASSYGIAGPILSLRLEALAARRARRRLPDPGAGHRRAGGRGDRRQGGPCRAVGGAVPRPHERLPPTPPSAGAPIRTTGSRPAPPSPTSSTASRSLQPDPGRPPPADQHALDWPRMASRSTSPK